MIITGNFKIETEANEELVFKKMKQFFIEQFQIYNFSVSGTEQTLNHNQPKVDTPITEGEISPSPSPILKKEKQNKVGK